MREGSILSVSTLDAEPGSSVELRDVLLVSDGDKITLGSPNVADAVVVAEVMGHAKARKVVNFKFKAKVRYRRKRGHRQPQTQIAIREIRIGDSPARPARRARAEAPADEAPAETPAPEAAAPRRRTRAPAAPKAAAVAPKAPARRRATTAKPAAKPTAKKPALRRRATKE